MYVSIIGSASGESFLSNGSIKPTYKYLKGMRYELAFVINATLLFVKSHAVYVFLGESNLLPLPSASTIRRMLSSSECSFGFSQLALDAICEKLKGCEEYER